MTPERVAISVESSALTATSVGAIALTEYKIFNVDVLNVNLPTRPSPWQAKYRVKSSDVIARFNISRQLVLVVRTEVAPVATLTAVIVPATLIETDVKLATYAVVPVELKTIPTGVDPIFDVIVEVTNLVAVSITETEPPVEFDT